MAEKKEKGKGNGLKIVIIILLTLVLVFGVAFGGYMVLSSKNSDKNTKTVNNNTQSSTAGELSPYTYGLDEFLVNLADESGKRFIKVHLYLGYDTDDEKKMSAELEANTAAVRDSINSILRSKKSTDVKTQKNIEDLKKEIITRINPYFEYGQITNIYFYDILIQ